MLNIAIDTLRITTPNRDVSHRNEDRPKLAAFPLSSGSGTFVVQFAGAGHAAYSCAFLTVEQARALATELEAFIAASRERERAAAVVANAERAGRDLNAYVCGY